MIIHSNTSYLSEPNNLIRALDIFFMGYQNFKNTRDTNGAVHTVANIMQIIIGSFTEADVESLFHYGQ